MAWIAAAASARYRAKQPREETPPANKAFSTPVSRGHAVFNGTGAGGRTLDLWIHNPANRIRNAQECNDLRDSAESVATYLPTPEHENAHKMPTPDAPGSPSIEGHNQATIGPQSGHNEATAMNLETIAATLRGLSPADRVVLADMLTTEKEKDP